MHAAGDVYVEWVEGEAVVLHRTSGEVHYLNPTAATVLAFVEEHGYERGVAEAAAHFGLGDEERDEFKTFLEDLGDRGIIAGARRPEPIRTVREPRAAPG